MFKLLQGVKPWEVNAPFSERAYFSVVCLSQRHAKNKKRVRHCVLGEKHSAA